MSVRDWRSLARSEVDPWYRAEEAWWQRTLAWETAANWALIEDARTAGTLPGLLAVDADASGPAGEGNAGSASGWAFYLIHRGILQIGALTTHHPHAADQLLDAILAVAAAARARGVMAFVPDADAWLEARLAAHGFAVRPFLYLMRPVDDPAIAGATPDGGGYRPERLTDVAALLQQAYPGADPARPFAPEGSGEAWLDYVGQLIAHTGCGVFEPEGSVLVDHPDRPDRPDASAPGRTGAPLAGAVLATRLAPLTGHLAQVAVHPGAQGQGLGPAMVQTAVERLAARGCARVSLLVAADNLTAVRMYRRLGFEESGRFLSAWRAQPTRSTMAACATDGASTLR